MIIARINEKHVVGKVIEYRGVQYTVKQRYVILTPYRRVDQTTRTEGYSYLLKEQEDA